MTQITKDVLDDPFLVSGYRCAEQILEPVFHFLTQRKNTIFSMRLEDYGGQILDEHFIFDSGTRVLILTALYTEMANILANGDKNSEVMERLKPALTMKIGGIIAGFVLLHDIERRVLD